MSPCQGESREFESRIPLHLMLRLSGAFVIIRVIIQLWSPVLHIKHKPLFYFFLISLLFLLCIKTMAFLDGRVYVWLYDGASQHLSALTYYSNYLKEIVSGIFHGDFSFPKWDLAIGEGSDILTTFHYYCIGDRKSVV